ncbi:MAG: lysylphosphatidylglycerol synthase transmembrane domain-containing protein [Buchananella hordeovulneris]|nr:lysylphosphatidylglycerol synthase transmembrane domain-containing protein [Buchananella hordeovulneris]
MTEEPEDKQAQPTASPSTSNPGGAEQSEQAATSSKKKWWKNADLSAALPPEMEQEPDPRVEAGRAAVSTGTSTRAQLAAADFGHSATANCLVIDVPERRTRKATDLVSMVLNLIGVGVVLLLAVVASNITHGVTQDVQNAVTTAMRQVLLVPVNVVEGLLTFFAPLLVLAELVLRRRYHETAVALVCAVLAGGTGFAVSYLLSNWAPEALVTGLTITNDGVSVASINMALTSITAVLAGVGSRDRLPSVRWSWYLLGLVIVLSVVRGALTLPGAIITVLLGRVVGHAVRYAHGVDPSSATNAKLVEAVRRTGISVNRLIRLGVANPALAEANWVTTGANLGAAELRSRQFPSGEDDAAEADLLSLGVAPAPLIDVAAMLAEIEEGTVPRMHVPASRIYAAWDDAGERTDVVVLDDDREVISILSHLWNRLRLQGLRTTPAVTLTTTANHALLMAQQAREAGINTHRFTGVTPAEDSLVLTAKHPPQLVPLSQAGALAEPLPPAEVARRVWEAVCHAHHAGLSHRSLEADTVWLNAEGQVWITDWDSGEVATNDLARRIDLAQTLALLTSQFGHEVALETAAEYLSEERLTSLAPVLQRLTLPRTTLANTGKESLQLLRDVLVSLMPAGESAPPPVQIARFSVRNLVMIVFAVFLIWGVLGSMNFSEIAATMRSANPWYLGAAFLMGMFYFVGGGLALQSFAVKAIRLWDAIVVQAASTIVSLVAPAGMGHVAVNLRFVLSRGETLPQALATVALWQTSQVSVTLVFLAILGFASGQYIDLSLPSSTVIYATAGTLAVLVLLLLLKPVRAWLWKKAGPTLKQIWPRLVWMAGNPMRLARGVSGNLLLTLGFVLTLELVLRAFDQDLPFATVAITYLASNAVGSLIPAPGGIGPVEAALTGGLSLAGVPAGAAFSVALMFRLVTMWAPCPLGWVALKYSEKRGLL